MEKKEPLSRKYTQLTSMLLSLDLKSSKKKELHLLAAKSLLSSSQVREAYLELEKAKSIQITDITEETLDYPLVYRLLDGIFGLSRQKIFSQYLNWFYNDQIASRLLELGKEYHQQGNFQEALYAYSESLNLNHKYDHIISHRLFQLANQFYLDKDINKAISIYKKTLDLDPERLILRLFLAEAFKVKGLFRETERIYHSIFKDNSQKELFPKIVYQEPIIIIDKNNSEWRLIFRAKNGTHFSGDITADNKFKNIKTERFSKKRDTWTLNKGRLHFSMQMDKRKLKIIEFENKEKNPLSFNLKINNRAERDKILIISSGRSPGNIPFTIK
jgi:tetratricopeptide (TPR) repeat protein